MLWVPSRWRAIGSTCTLAPTPWAGAGLAVSTSQAASVAANVPGTFMDTASSTGALRAVWVGFGLCLRDVRPGNSTRRRQGIKRRRRGLFAESSLESANQLLEAVDAAFQLQQLGPERH